MELYGSTTAIYYSYNKLLLNSLKETKKELLSEKRKKSLIKLGAPQVKIFLIPSGTVLSPDGTFVAAPPRATVGNGIAFLPSSAQEGNRTFSQLHLIYIFDLLKLMFINQ